MNAGQIMLGLFAYLLGALSLAWVSLYLYGVGVAGAGGNTPDVATMFIHVFPLPVLAVSIAALALRSWRKREKTKRWVWLLAPAGFFGLAALLIAFLGCNLYGNTILV